MINFKSVEVDDDSILNAVISKKQGRKQGVCDECKQQGVKKIPDDCESCDNVDHKHFLRTVEPYIKLRYQIFRRNTDNIDNIFAEGKIKEKERKLLEDSYKSAADVKKLKIQIKNHLPDAIKGKCPYCMISAHNTMDHYFDKSSFPEYSLLSKNLIPCCSECNGYKGTKLRDTNGVRETINFYYDALPNRQFIFFDMCVDFESSNPIPTFEVRLELDASVKIDCIIGNHFSTLHLAKRYQDQIPEKFSTMIEAAKISYNRYGQDIQDIILSVESRIIALRKINGLNYWEACLYEGIIKEKDIFEKLLQQS